MIEASEARRRSASYTGRRVRSTSANTSIAAAILPPSFIVVSPVNPSSLSNGLLIQDPGGA